MKTIGKIAVICLILMFVFIALHDHVWKGIIVPYNEKEAAAKAKTQQITRVMWSGEVTVGSEEVAIKIPPTRSAFRFDVKNSEGTKVLIRLHGGDAHFIQVDGKPIKEIVLKNGVSEKEIMSEDWEGRVEWIGATNLNEGMVKIVSVEVPRDQIRTP
jgi:hypothetical protein